MTSDPLKDGLLNVEQRAIQTLRNSSGQYSEDRKPDIVAAPRALQLLDFHELQGMREAAWIVDKAIPEGGSVAVIGPTKQYKTFLALDLSASISLGLPWQGRDTVMSPVVYVAGEGAAGIRKRLNAWAMYYGCEPNVLVLPHSIDFGSTADITALVSAIWDKVDGNIGLIVVDTLNRNMQGDENSSEYVARYMSNCDQIRKCVGAAVLTIHHSGHATGTEAGRNFRARGSSALQAAMDTVFLCRQINGGDRVELYCDKQKDDVDGWAVEFEVLPFAKSLVLNASGVTSAKLTGQRLLALQVLHRDFGKDGAASKAWQEATEIEGDSSFQKARKWLEQKGYVRKKGRRLYTVSDSGLMALQSGGYSTPSTTALPVLHSGGSNYCTATRGSLVPPVVEVEQGSAVEQPNSGRAA